MAQTPIYRFSGQSFALACGTAVSAAVTVPVAGADTQTCAFLNSTNTAVAVTTTVLNSTAAPAGFVFPTHGVPSAVPCFILPPLMEMPMVVVVPQGGFNVFGIGQTGTPVIQFTRCELQS